MEQVNNFQQISLRNISAPEQNQIQSHIMNMNEVVMKDMETNKETSRIGKVGTELILKNKSFKFGMNMGNMNSIMVKGSYADIGNILNCMTTQMIETRQYNSTLEMLKNLKKINQYGNDENIKAIIDENNTNICKFVVDITRGVAEYVKNGFLQINNKINNDNMNLDLTVNNIGNELNEIWKYLNEDVFNDLRR